MPFLKLRKYGFASRILIIPSLILSFWVILIVLIVTRLLKVDFTVDVILKILMGLQVLFYLIFLSAYPSSSKYELMKNEIKYSIELEKKSIRTLLIVSFLLLTAYCIVRMI